MTLASTVVPFIPPCFRFKREDLEAANFRGLLDVLTKDIWPVLKGTITLSRSIIVIAWLMALYVAHTTGNESLFVILTGFFVVRL